jgi:hypothetical protein
MMQIIGFLFIAGFVGFIGYHLAIAIFHAVKIQLKHANDLEKQFGHDVIGAAKYTFLGKK